MKQTAGARHRRFLMAGIVATTAALLGLVLWLSQGSDQPIGTGNEGDRTVQTVDETTEDGPAAPIDTDSLTRTSWTLRFGAGADGEIGLVEGWPITINFDGQQLGGTAAFNDYGTSYNIDGLHLTIDGIDMNMMGCAPEVQASEQAFLAAMSDVDGINLIGDELALSGPATELLFVRNTPVRAGELLDTLWLLESLIRGEAATSAAGDPATLRILSDGTFRGSSGCRPFEGRYQIFGNSVQFNDFAAGEGGCPTSLQDQDNQIFGVLGDGFTTAIDENKLIVTSTGGEGLAYRAVTENELAETPSQPATSDAEALDGIEWVFVAGFSDSDNPELVTLEDPRNIDPTQRITLRLSGESYEGTLVCNSYGGETQIDSGAISFSEPFSTRVGCPSEFTDLANGYTAALSQMSEFGIEADGTRLVMNGNDIELHFEQTG